MVVKTPAAASTLGSNVSVISWSPVANSPLGVHFPNGGIKYFRIGQKIEILVRTTRLLFNKAPAISVMASLDR